MDHQPFEEWIFKENDITDQEYLNQHLATCKQCTELQKAWEQVESILSQSEIVSPAPGFASRFAEKMAIEKEHLLKRQTIRSLTILGVLLIVISLLLATIFVLSFSAGDMIVGLVTTYTSLIQAFINLRGMVFQVIHNISPILIAFIWLLLMIWGMLLTPVWGVTVWKLSKRGVKQI